MSPDVEGAGSADAGAIRPDLTGEAPPTDRITTAEGSGPPIGTPVFVVGPAVEPDPPRLSFVRIVVALVIIAATLTGTTAIALRLADNESPNADQWFAPYVDVTLTPAFDFQDPVANPNLDVVLAFVVASPDDRCTPSWGGYHGLDEAATELDLDRRIARLRQRGGDAIISFGGVVNDELATVCLDGEALAAAYRSVVVRYDVRTIDLDLEGAALGNPEVAGRRATAIATLQATEREAGRALDVWLTLPVSPTGLTGDGVATVDAFLAAGVDLAGVNIMTMDFGESRSTETSFVAASIAAVDATQAQLVRAFAAVGTTITPAEAYARMGVSPMIGQNDVPADRLDTAGAEELVSLTRERGVRRYSMWSLNRDAPCGGNIDTVIVSNSCSGVEQTRLQFSRIFGSAGGRPADVADLPEPSVRGAASSDAVGPYDAWRMRREYDAGAEVVWAGQVYVAKWWNVSVQPDAPVEHEWESPWRVVGPVLQTEAAPVATSTLPEGSYPSWTREDQYQPGDWVERRGLAYRAKWWNRGTDPAADVDNPWESPWEAIDVDVADIVPTTTTTTTTETVETTPQPSL
jgi:chitinase